MRILRPRIIAVVVLGVGLAIALAARASAPALTAPRFGALAPASLGANLSGAANVFGAAPASTGPVVVTELKHDTSAPLRSMTPAVNAAVVQDPDSNQVLSVPNSRSAGAGALFRDPVLQSSPRGANVPSPIVSFNGVGTNFGGWPPDTEGAVGPNNYVQWVNLQIQVFDRNGVSLLGPEAGNTLWSGFGGLCQTNNSGDPIALYDHLADRWMMSQFAFTSLSGPFHTCIAVSTTGDPTGTWNRYDFLYSSSKLNDYPKFGVWPDGYYMTVNQFSNNATVYAGQGVAVFERSQMLTGGVARMVQFDLASTDLRLGGMLPSDLDGPAPAVGEPNHFSEVDDGGVAGGFPQDQLQIWDFHVDWTNTALSTFTHIVDLATAPFDSNLCNFSRNCIPQPSTSQKLDTLSDRLMYRLQYRNFGDHTSLVTNHTVDVDGTDHAGVRWYEVRNTGGTWSIFQQGTYAPDASHRWMGSAAMNSKGEIALGYSNSSSTVFPSVKYTGRVATDPLGTMPQGEGTLVAGSGSQTDASFHRWGDYSTMTVDPVDDCTFWYTQEWIQTTGTNTWKTRIGSFQVTNCGTVTTGTLTGTVTNANTSAPISGALVDAGGGHTATTDAGGNYTIANLPAGSYSVTASATGFSSSTVTGVAITAGNTTTQNFALAPVTATGTLRGLVTNASTSAAISGALVDAGGGHTATTASNGRYQITGLPAGSYSVTASASGFVSSTVNGVVISGGATTTKNFALTPVTTGCTSNCLRVSAITLRTTGTGVSGRVTIQNEAGVAVSGAAVTVLWNLPGGGTSTQTVTTNASGLASFSVTGGAGTYTITVTNVTKAGSTFDAAGSTILTKSITK